VKDRKTSEKYNAYTDLDQSFTFLTVAEACP